MTYPRGKRTQRYLREVCTLLLGCMTFVNTVAAQDNKILGEQGNYLVSLTRGAESQKGRLVAEYAGNKLSRTASYSDHPLHELASSIRPGVQLDAHSKALLRTEPSAHLVAFVQDSLYVARPGIALVHLIVDGRSRRSNIIPDSLFVIPPDRYIYGIQVTRDLLLGRIAAYRKRSSRIVGVFSMSIDGRPRVVVVSSHDHLPSPDVSLAVFTPALIFEDLIRIHLGKLGVLDMLPTHYGPSTLTWQDEFGQDIVFHLQKIKDTEGEKVIDPD